MNGSGDQSMPDAETILDTDLEAEADTTPVQVIPPRAEVRDLDPTAPVMFEVTELNVYYGDFHAVRGFTAGIKEHEITAFIGPSGCGKSTILRCFNRMNDLIDGARVEGKLLYHGTDLYAPAVDPVEVRRRVGMVFQKPNPFPKSIYDNIAFGPKINGYKGVHGRPGGAFAAPGRALGRGQGQARRVRLRPQRRAAAAAVHRPGHRHQPRRAADGRALLGARPGGDAQDRATHA